MSGRNWYAVYTKPQSEKKVSALLSKKKIENFCPHNRVLHGTGRKRKMVYEPLFPNFVFVFVAEIEMAEVRKTSDVFNFVYWLGKPAIIKTPEIENIAHFNGAYYNIKVEKIPVNSAGMVRIANSASPSSFAPGPNGQGRVIKLTLPSLGFAMAADPVNAAPGYEHAGKNTEAVV